jgi:Homeodomain-like domain
MPGESCQIATVDLDVYPCGRASRLLESAPADRSISPQPPAVRDDEPTFDGKPLAEIAMEQLRGMDRPEKATAIHRALKGKGYVIPWKGRTKHYKPVYNALVHREADVGDVFRTGPGEWNLAEWHTPGEVELLKQRHVKASAEHIERTKRGIQEAKLRGIQIGGRPLMTTEKIARALQMSNDGMRLQEIADVLGVSRSTIRNYVRGNSPPRSAPTSDLVGDAVAAERKGLGLPSAKAGRFRRRRVRVARP